MGQFNIRKRSVYLRLYVPLRTGCRQIVNQHLISWSFPCGVAAKVGVVTPYCIEVSRSTFVEYRTQYLFSWQRSRSFFFTRDTIQASTLNPAIKVIFSVSIPIPVSCKLYEGAYRK